MARVEQVTKEILMLGEGPHWDEKRQCLYFVDIERKTLHKYDTASNSHAISAPLDRRRGSPRPRSCWGLGALVGVELSLEVFSRKTHTSTRLDESSAFVSLEIVDGRVGFVIPVAGARDHFLVGVEREVWEVEWNGAAGATVNKLRRLAEVDHNEPGNRINDAKTDPRGRLFFGTMGPDVDGNFTPGRGSLYRLDGDSVKTLCNGVGISNGLAWDSKRGKFYYIDSLERAVSQFDYDVTTGEISNKGTVVSMEQTGIQGFPDGMSIDREGRLWVAVFGGNRVLQVDAETGAVLQSVRIPAEQVTSVAWGGTDYDVLYVTTASMTIGGQQPEPAGALFRITGLQAKRLAPTEVKLV